jgi:L-lactate dehydrogenase (cytochrome)
MPTLALAPGSTSDYRLLAERRLPRNLFDYIDGGAYDEETLRRNVEDLRGLKLRQRVMRDVSSIDTSIELLGEKWTMPVGLSPIGMGGMMRRRAETQAVRAAQAFGIPFCLSTVAICSLSEVAAAAAKPFWFQLYMLRDRGHVTDMLGRAKNAGCRTLAFTVDLAVTGARYRDPRNGVGVNLPPLKRLRAGFVEYALHPAWSFDVGLLGGPHVFGNLAGFVPGASKPGDFAGWAAAQIDPSVTWKDIAWLRSVWDGNLVVKGVLSAEDAIEAAAVGADAVIVSNHGGRQLDGVSSTIRVLPRVVDAVGARIPVIMDGGVRSGLDVARALASGARAVMMGRPWIWSVAAQGEQGLANLLQTFMKELRVAMALTGTTNIAELTKDILERE